VLIIRGGRLVDIARRSAEAPDILVDGDTISAVVPAGAAAPPDAQVIDARGTFGGQLSRLLPIKLSPYNIGS